MNKTLLNFLAEACNYAQEHVCDPDAWPTDTSERESYLQCVSYQVACFLAQNTARGENGVCWDIIIYPLIDNALNEQGFMVKSVEEWKKIINDLAQDLGGWKN